jgi:cyclic pyranopterin monophosphate synthase
MSQPSRTGVFGFEEVTEDLEWLPLAARRALDASGAALSLATWQTLDLETRWRFVAFGNEETVPVERVQSELGRLGDWSVCETWHEPPQPSPELLLLVPRFRDALAREWARLGGLERYALAKMAASGRRSAEERARRVDEACAALLMGLTHLDARGAARMVDIHDKAPTTRTATASARLIMQPTTVALLRDGQPKKGDVFAAARIAGIQAAKRTAELIPLCHTIALRGVEVELELHPELPGVRIVARVKTVDRTGVEMEALVACSIAGLTLYDMLKSVDRTMVLEGVQLDEKRGGRSGDFVRGAV